MPRSVLKNPYEDASRIVFGERGARNMKYVAQRTKIPHSTCLDYQKHIEKMPLERFAWVCEASRLTDEEIVSAVKKLFRG